MSNVNIVVDYFHEEFKRSEVAKQYVKSRGLTKETVVKFKIGYAPSHPKYGERFRNRIIFPIWDQRGILVGWTGRTLVNDDAKYVNVKESLSFKKNRLLYAYNFAVDSIFETQAAVLCEGQMDAITMHQFGITNAVASSGTSSFRLAAACLLARFARRVYLVFDGDQAGRDAAIASQKHLNDVGVTDVIDVVLPEGEDPASLLTKYDKNYFLRLLYDARQNREASQT